MDHDAETQAGFDAIIEAWGNTQALTPDEMQAKLPPLIVLEFCPEEAYIETARDDGDSWWVQEWERYEMSGQWYWRAASGYRIDKSVVAQLGQAQTHGLMTTPTPSAPGSYREARGVIPYDPDQPKPEEIIHKMREAW